MEKRTLLAIVLSILVLYIYSAIAPSSPRSVKNTQYVVNKEDEKPLSSSSSDLFSETTPLPPEKKLPIATKVLENEKLTLEFSTTGGVLRSITLKENNHAFPVFSIFDLPAYANENFSIEELTQESIRFSFKAEGGKIVKEYILGEDGYSLDARTTIWKEKRMSKDLPIQFSAMTIDFSSVDNSQLGHDKSLFEYSVSTGEKVVRKGNAFSFSKKEQKSGVPLIQGDGKVWFGFRDRYFCAVVKPYFEIDQYFVNPSSDKAIELNFSTENGAGLDQASDAAVTYRSFIYIGPQNPVQLSSYEQGIENIVSFSNFWLFDIIAKFIYKLIYWIHGIIPNWGVCIILASVLIYGAMYPLTAKGMASMKRMQSLQPKVAELKEKHAANPQKLNKEIMELYKTNRVNPLGGCFPFLLQMPIFIGLYQVLWRAVIFKGAGFLWIKDLSEPDRLFLLPFNLPLLGNEINILPLIMMVVMYFQQKFSAGAMVTTDPAQASQQKIMRIFFPLFLGFIFYKFASGLTLYFTTFYFLSTLTQWKMSKVVVVK